MKKLILLLLFLSAFASPTYSQSDTSRIWITPEQEARVFRDRAILAVQGRKIVALKKENDSLRTVLQELIFENRSKLDSLTKILYRDSAKISMLQLKIEHSDKVIASKDVAIDKWKRGYYQNLKFRKEFVWNSIGKWIEIGGVAGIICLAVYGGMWLSQNVDLSLSLSL